MIRNMTGIGPKTEADTELNIGSTEAKA